MSGNIISVTRQVAREKGLWYTPWWYEGRRRLIDRVALVTGAGASVGQAISIAMAREGADVLLSFAPETKGGALETSAWVESAGRTAILSPFAAKSEAGCMELAQLANQCFGRIDIVVNAEDVTPELCDDGESSPRSAALLFDTCVPHMPAGSALADTLWARDTPDRRGDFYEAEASVSAMALSYSNKRVRANGVCIGTRRQYRDMFSEECEVPGYLADIATAHVLLASEPSVNGTIIRFTG